MKRVLTGMRPTGNLHLGHLYGVLAQAVALQETYECFFEVADIHAYTTNISPQNTIADAVENMVRDYLAAGLDPARSTIFLQSAVPEISEIHTLLSMVVPLPYLERQPTYKAYLGSLEGESRPSYGFLGYPLLQASDILAFGTHLVPVGPDQMPHIEFASFVGKRFNDVFGVDTLVEPKATEASILEIPGTDGRKMSKSYDNCIYLSDSEEETTAKILGSYTDPTRIRKTDPGHPETCPVFAYRQITKNVDSEATAQLCRSGLIGCVSDKRATAEVLNTALRPLRERRAQIDSSEIRVILKEGSEQAREHAARTLASMKRAMKFYSTSPFE